MSVQPPPTNPTSPVYNPINYVNPTTSGVDVAFLDANYLQFPTAQGSEEFTDGLFTTNTIDFNSSTGTDREITGLSKSNFTDILGNTLYTASIEENSTAIGAYDGGLIINSSNSINLVGTSILANGSPIGTGTGNVSTTDNNTFLSPATTQTFNNQEVQIDTGFLTFPNDGYIRWGNGTSLLDFPNYNGTFPPNDNQKSGLALDWNQQPSNGEVDFFCYGQGGQGGFAFYAMTNTTAPTLITNMFPNGISFFKDIVSNNTFTDNNYFNIGYLNIYNLTSVPPSLPIGYSQYLSVNNAPWFSPSNGGGVQLATLTSLASYAPITNPSFLGAPTAPTPATNDNSTNIATTAFVQTAVGSISGFAPINSPVFTGNPTSTTNPGSGDNSQSLATTSWVLSNTSGSGLNTAYPSKAVFARNGISSNNQWESVVLAGSNGSGIPYYQAICFLYVPTDAPMTNIILRVNFIIVGQFSGSGGAPPGCLSAGCNFPDVLISINVSNYSSQGSGNPQVLGTDYKYDVITSATGLLTGNSLAGYGFTPFSLSSARVGQMLIYLGFPAIPTIVTAANPYPTGLATGFTTSINCSVEIVSSTPVGMTTGTYNDFATFPNSAPGQSSFGGGAYLEIYQG